MVAYSETRRGHGAEEPPAAFLRALDQVRAATMRVEVAVEEMPAPQRIAPWATAITADVEVEEDEVGTGRLILLHDPQGNDTWQGTFRLVAYSRAEIDPELAIDPLLGEVGWTWLTDALTAHGATWRAASGTVTRVATEAFGGMVDEPTTAQLEIRASWTPDIDEDQTSLRAHVEAWGELLCTAVGLPPVPEGVAAFPQRRGQRSNTTP
ncbi:DUF3000 domain-containing protein [Nocardioides jishulii]|uniref:DUF3000 domain-containing protein n=1 Tax=Nocardioides jishulii TaxID=2575440 RepID=A0A4U2YID6_9ACTN|nr:DUF3000 domain-containing protein [Nocardioides jishulii]QCX26617.1 DUF3000 family protein [Nocardioides jishulii]TKI60414.1 DUF3000 domain-containing protein [Nocardioides jishulii]